MKKLESNVLRKACEINQFDFESTRDITEFMTFLGQERLTSALEFGTKMDQKGYNIFALGPNKTDKHNLIREFLEKKLPNHNIPKRLVLCK